MSRAFIQMMREEHEAEMNGVMAKKAPLHGSLSHYDSDEETVETVIQQTSWKSTGSSYSVFSPGASEALCLSRRSSSWWNLDEGESSSHALSTENRSKVEESKRQLPPRRRDPLDITTHCRSCSEKSKKDSTRLSWWDLEDEGHVKLSSESSRKVDAKLAIANIEHKELEKKKKTKSDKKKRPKSGKKKKTSKTTKNDPPKTDKKKAKKSKKKQKEDKQDVSACSILSTETETQPMYDVTIEEMEKESDTLGFDAGLTFKVNVRKLQALVALEKSFCDSQMIVAKSTGNGTQATMGAAGN